MYSDHNRIVLLIEQFLKRANRTVKTKELTEVLLSHPFYPAVSAISQTLTYFGIGNKVFRKDYAGILKANAPGLAHLKDNRFILLLKADASRTTYYDPVTGQYATGSAADFRDRWSGHILYLTGQTPKTACSPRFHFHLSHLYLLCCLLLVGGGIAVHILFPTNGLSFLLLKISGFAACLGFIGHHLSPGTESSSPLCKISAGLDCSQVLQSPVSRLLGKIPLSAGLIYFCTGMLALLYGYPAHCGTATLTLLSYVSAAGLPFATFSLIYQGMIIKKWCPLCIAACSTVWIENILFYFYPLPMPCNGSLLPPLLILAFSGITAAAITLLLRIYATAEEKSENAGTELLKLKRNPTVAYSLFRQGPRLNTEAFSDLSVGEKNAPHTFATVLNPSCKSCQKAANDIIRLLETYPQKIKWMIRFDGTAQPEHSPLNRMQLHLLELHQKISDGSKFLAVLKAWFTHPSPDAFTRHYPVAAISPDTVARLNEHIRRNQKDKIYRMPYIAVGRRPLPKMYAISDLAYFFPEEKFLKKITDG